MDKEKAKVERGYPGPTRIQSSDSCQLECEDNWNNRTQIPFLTSPRLSEPNSSRLKWVHSYWQCTECETFNNNTSSTPTNSSNKVSP